MVRDQIMKLGRNVYIILWMLYKQTQCAHVTRIPKHDIVPKRDDGSFFHDSRFKVVVYFLATVSQLQDRKVIDRLVLFELDNDVFGEMCVFVQRKIRYLRFL